MSYLPEPQHRNRRGPRPVSGWTLNPEVARRFGYPITQPSREERLETRVDDLESWCRHLEELLIIVAHRSEDSAVWDALEAQGYKLGAWSP